MRLESIITPKYLEHSSCFNIISPILIFNVGFINVNRTKYAVTSLVKAKRIGNKPVTEKYQFFTGIDLYINIITKYK